MRGNEWFLNKDDREEMQHLMDKNFQFLNTIKFPDNI